MPDRPDSASDPTTNQPRPADWVFDADPADTHPGLNPSAAEADPPVIEIPWSELSQPALRGLIEEFVTRDGTDTADAEAKTRAVHRRLAAGEAVVYWDPVEQRAQIQAKEPPRKSGGKPAGPGP